ncbi:heterokaryon incompatibility protein-domain-containing protein [Diaporthe sp. PMI_573]|nr:heterokaryon incompatibility protein-domain-containing protein [Diaporthaceae sp. PMI_573]
MLLHRLTTCVAPCCWVFCVMLMAVATNASGSVTTPTHGLVQIPSDPENGVFLRPYPDVPEGTKYAALSYCWGKRQVWPACRTTRQNLGKQLQQIPWATLPATLQDAVKATRQLGLEYIWIDSMCIIQDDEEDWQVESMQMATVYAHAHVTLCAALALDTRTGMFSQRNMKSLSHILTIRFRGEEFPIYAFHVPQESGRIEPRLLADIWRGSLERSLEYPMFNRAWTFQERLASRRLLLFGKEELIMECASECVFEETQYRLHPPQLSDKTLKAAYAGAMDSPRKIWWEIVYTYSHLKITIPTDRLPAIAAVAQRLALHSPTDEYLCGLWRNSFLSDLLWERVLNDLDRGYPPLILTDWGARTYVAPSWSWCAFRGKTRNISNIVSPLSNVLSVHLDYKDNSRFGRVAGGSVKMSGPMIDLWWHVRAHWKYSQFLDGEQEMIVPGNPDQKVTFSVDYDFYNGLPGPGFRIKR